jgi:hypothetical protein
MDADVERLCQHDAVLRSFARRTDLPETIFSGKFRRCGNLFRSAAPDELAGWNKNDSGPGSIREFDWNSEMSGPRLLIRASLPGVEWCDGRMRSISGPAGGL